MPLPEYKDIEGIHGTFGLYTLLIFPAFVHYAFQRGKRRLIQSDSLTKLSLVGQPIWWYTLNRLANTLTLLALTFALFGGKMMDETWLPKGELDHVWYYTHLVFWVVMVVAIALHLLLNVRVGGAPLLVSMWNVKFRPKDAPRLWPEQVLAWGHKAKRRAWSDWFHVLLALPQLELAILGILIVAWAISLVKEFIPMG